MDAHRTAIAKRFGSRIAAGDAVFLTSADGIDRLPCTIAGDGEVREMSGMNLFVLMQVMKDRGWRDSRFFTLAQVNEAGWSLRDDAVGVRLRYFSSVGADGLPLEQPVSTHFQVFNASQIEGVPAVEKRDSEIRVDDLWEAATRAGFGGHSGDGKDVPRAVYGWCHGLQGWASGNGGLGGLSGDVLLRSLMASSLIAVQTGFEREGVVSENGK